MVKQDFSITSKKMISANLDNEEYDKLLKIRDNNPDLIGSASVIKWLIKQFDLSTQSIKQVSDNIEKINLKVETGEIDRSDFDKWLQGMNKDEM